MKKEKTSSGRLVFWALAIVFLWILVSKFGQTKHLVEVLSTGKWYWVILAVVCQLFYYPFYAYFVDSVFRIFDVKLPRTNILKTYIASKFTDVALPVATLGEVAIYVRNGKRNNISPLNAGIGISFALLFEVVSFALLTALLLLTLFVFHQERAYLYITSVLLILVLLVIIWLLIRIAVQKKPLSKFFLWVIYGLARVAGQRKVTMDEIDKIANEIGFDLKRRKKKIWPTFRLALMTHVINLLTFAFIFLAFAGHVNVLAILAGYVAGLLYTVVSITPQGVGVAEGVMITTLHSFGLDVSTSAVITLAFRGLLYWLPLFAGFYVFSHLELQDKAEELK